MKNRIMQAWPSTLSPARIRAAPNDLPSSFSKIPLEGYPDEDVFARLLQLRSRRDQDASLPPKLAEFDVFASGELTIGDNLPGSLLYAETLTRSLWDTKDDPVLRPIRNLVVVHRLREVCCLYSFTRFEAAPTSADGDLEDYSARSARSAAELNGRLAAGGRAIW
jgi:hypothetical protein